MHEAAPKAAPRDTPAPSLRPEHRRKTDAPAPKKDPSPEPAPQPKQDHPTTNLRGPTPDEILADPLVRTVLDVFEGEVKRIHPRQRPSGE
ncbi:MAG: hypothetical protein AB8F26_13475 [Phycisphaerales bacterium]